MTKMPKLDRSDLLKFLSKPRFSHEVAEHFGISRRLANLHLREAVRSGEIYISKLPLHVPQNAQEKTRPLTGSVYAFKEPATRTGPAYLEEGSPTRLAQKNAYPDPNTQTAKQLVQTSQEGVPKKRLPHWISGGKMGLQLSTNLKLVATATSGLRMSGARMELTRKSATGPSAILRKRPRPVGGNQLSHAGKIRLLQTLSDEPLPFLDIHSRLGVSRQTITALVKNGFLNEFWGKDGVGIRFRLTRKGDNLLRQLEAAARYEPPVKKKQLIRLKHVSQF